MTFTRTVENFICEHCGKYVIGNGYTNHCPHCLWSKHVDKDPGDRLEACGGLMEPMMLEGSSPKYRILHKCKTCGIGRVNKVQEEDAVDAIIALAAHSRKPFGEEVDLKTGRGADPLAAEEAQPEAEKGQFESNIRMLKKERQERKAIDAAK